MGDNIKNLDEFKDWAAQMIMQETLARLGFYPDVGDYEIGYGAVMIAKET